MFALPYWALCICGKFLIIILSIYLFTYIFFIYLLFISVINFDGYIVGFYYFPQSYTGTNSVYIIICAYKAE